MRQFAVPSVTATSRPEMGADASGPRPRRGNRSIIAFLSVAALSTVALLIPGAVSAQAVATVPRQANTAGSAPVGSTAYPIPAGAVFVSPTGHDTAAGRVTSPVATLAEVVPTSVTSVRDLSGRPLAWGSTGAGLRVPHGP